MAEPHAQTWKVYAGREQGRDGYQFGDIARHFWRKITGPRLPEGVDDDDMALLDLKVQRDQLAGHRRRTEAQVGRDEGAAKACLREGKKPQAMLALRKKKMHEKLLQECQQHLARVDELIENVEVTRMQKDTVEALAAGVATLKKMQKEIGGVDYIQQLMDERQEALDAQRELGEALAGAGVAADDADALAEFARLEEACALDKLTTGAPAGQAPTAAPAAAAPPEVGATPAESTPAQPAAAQPAGAVVASPLAAAPAVPVAA